MKITNLVLIFAFVFLISCDGQKGNKKVLPTVTDIDGNVYNTVKIGKQVWTVENLRVTKLNDGTAIPMVEDIDEWDYLSTPAYCWYDNDSVNKNTYGALYNWYTVDTGLLAPEGWHVATEDEWASLMWSLIKNGYNWDGSNEENKVAKSLAAKEGWLESSSPGVIGNDLTLNNTTGFSALAGGSRGNSRLYDGELCEFMFKGEFCSWWTATEILGRKSYYRSLDYDREYLFSHYLPKTCGMYVRLVKE